MRHLFALSPHHALLAALLLGFAVLFALFSLPLLFEKIPPNWLYGIRISRTFESEEHWYRINKYFARRMLHGCIFLCALGVASLFVAQPLNEWLAVGLLIVCSFLVVMDTLRYARRL